MGRSAALMLVWLGSVVVACSHKTSLPPGGDAGDMPGTAASPEAGASPTDGGATRGDPSNSAVPDPDASVPPMALDAAGGSAPEAGLAPPPAMMSPPDARMQITNRTEAGCTPTSYWLFPDEGFSDFCGTIGDASQFVCNTMLGCRVEVNLPLQMVYCPSDGGTRGR